MKNDHHSYSQATRQRQFVIAIIIGIFSGMATIGFSYVMSPLVKDMLVGFGIGFFIGFLTSWMQIFIIPRNFKRLNFTLYLFVNLFAFFMIQNIVVPAFLIPFGFAGETYQLPSFFFRQTYLNGLVFGLGVDLVIVFFYMINSILGHNLLLWLITGRYHHPRQEQVIVMFLDITSFTSISEKLGDSLSLSLVNDFFTDIADAVAMSRGDIYKYVGDGAIVIWQQEKGLRDARCIRSFFWMQEIIESRKEKYLKQYGLVPGFKAGIHNGPVMVGEVGFLKKEIAYMGDVLNTASRLEGECNRLGEEFVISGVLHDLLKIPDELEVYSHGPGEVRGKEEQLVIMGVRKAKKMTGSSISRVD